MNQPIGRFTANTRIAGWLSVLCATSTFCYLQAAYLRLPLVVPVSFSAGNPDQFAIKSPELVFLPFGLQVALGVVFGAAAAIIVCRRSAAAPGVAAAARHTAEGIALLAVVWIAFQAINAWRLTELLRRTYDANVEVYVLALVTAIAVSVVIGARVMVQVNEAGPVERLRDTVLRDRSRLATALLAVVLAAGIGAPLYLLSVVWEALHPL